MKSDELVRKYKEEKLTPYLANHRVEYLALGLILLLHLYINEIQYHGVSFWIILLAVGIWLLLLFTTSLPETENEPKTLDDYWDMERQGG